MTAGDFLSGASYLLIILDLIVALFIVFYGRKNPTTTWAWLMVILIIPYGGIIIYFIFGMDGRKHTLFLRKNRADELIYQNYLESGMESAGFVINQKEGFNFNGMQNIGSGKSVEILPVEGDEFGDISPQNRFAEANPVEGDEFGDISPQNRFAEANPVEGDEFGDISPQNRFADMVYLNMFPGTAAYYSDNDVRLFYDGVSKFKSLLEDIAAAKSFIHLQYYIVKNDALGKEIFAALEKKAAEGVEVRFLLDGMGSYGTPKRFYRPLKNAGGKVAVFQPPYFIRLNYRNHRKICVIDGSIGYIGGLNIGDEYVSKKKRFGFWRDTHIRVVGGIANQLQLRFIMDWNFCSGDKMELDDKYFTNEEFSGNTGIQIVSSGPDTKWPSIHYAYNKMITEAEKYVYIQSPYFVPDDSVFESLRIAALSGIDVRIMIPAVPDHPFVYWAGLSYLGELLDDGVKCYEYTKGFVHSKLVIVDGCVSSVGTANMDVRSFKLNFETNAFMYDAKVASDLERQFLLDIADSRQITIEDYNRRSSLTKIKESFSRLLSPLL